MHNKNVTAILDMSKIVFSSKFPKDLAELIKPIFDELDWLVPSWAEEVIIHHTPTDADIDASCEINYGGRFITISIHPLFFETNSEDRFITLIHELVHGFGKVFADYSRTVIKQILSDEDDTRLMDLILNEMYERNEAMTQDLAYAIYNKLYKNRIK